MCAGSSQVWRASSRNRGLSFPGGVVFYATDLLMAQLLLALVDQSEMLV